ncbi:hypothetical protein QTP88_000831 [Uroleucon formosanum]
MGKCTMNKIWFEKTDNLGYKISEWAKQFDKTQIFCIVCSNNIQCDKNGYQAVLQHSKTDKHKDNCKSKLNLKQLHLSLVSKSSSVTATEVNESTTVIPDGNLELGVYYKQEDATKAELMWTMKSVLCNMSGSSCDGLAELFKAMFPKAVPDKFSLCRTKMSYLITDALGPHFRQIILDEIQNYSTYYTLMYDETTNSETIKIEEYLMLALDNADLPKEKLLMLGSDEPNVNKKVFRLVNEGIKSSRGHGLIDIGSCNINIVHNAFLKGLDNYGSDVSEFVIIVYYFFKGWPKRWEDYSIIQNEKGIPFHRFIKHCSSRWLTLGAAAERILEQWEALMHYFKIFVPKHRNEILKPPKFLKIISFLKQLELKPEIIFVVNSAKMFQQFNLTFQRQEPLIHVMYDKLWKLLITIGGKVCKETALSAWNNNDSLFINENLKPLSSIELSHDVLEILATFDEKNKIMFLKNVQTYYKAAGSHILERSSFNYATKIKYFRCLQPNELKKYPFITKVVKAASTLSHGSADIERHFSVFDQLKSAQKHQDRHKKASDILLHDANVRLKKTIERNYVIEMKIAQSMVETATKLRNEEREKET